MANIQYGFFCEDIRQERFNKVTAVGLWGSRCIVPSVPAVLRSLGFYALVSNPENQPHPFRIRLSAPCMDLPTGPPQPEGLLNVRTSSQGLGLMLSPARIQSEGDVEVSVEIDADPPIRQTFVLEIRVGDLTP